MYSDREPSLGSSLNLPLFAALARQVRGARLVGAPALDRVLGDLCAPALERADPVLHALGHAHRLQDRRLRDARLVRHLGPIEVGRVRGDGVGMAQHLDLVWRLGQEPWLLALRRTVF